MRNRMTKRMDLGGSFTLPGTSMTLNRMGYGAMQLAGPHVTNQIIKQALHPYPDGLVIVTKVGARRGEDKSWIHALSHQELVDAVHDNLRNLGLEKLDVVNLRVGGISE